ncbi:MAG: anthranilate 1,2-dioxygenase small subunit [Rhodospirillaceae bacterium]|jgi:anthranilate 1,2-dioxygenase small subunit|nr:anthranilate 1,2-dioxygenase small subunit [Rhodospirillaceae bacterium]
MSGISTQDVIDLEYDYVVCLDENRIEDWPDLFVKDGLYEVFSRENVEMNLEFPIVNCKSYDMLQDRVLCLRKTTVYTFHYPRHLISNIRVKPIDGGTLAVSANFALYQTDLEGRTSLFSTGKYDDLVDTSGTTPKFKRKRVIMDTFSVNNMISMPI